MQRLRMQAGALVAASAAVLAGCGGTAAPSAAGNGHSSASSASAAARPTAPADPISAVLSAATGPSYLQPGSNPAVLPGPILIADKANSRLLIVDPQGRIRWQFPRPGDIPAGTTFKIPDDAFFTPDGRYIIATEEDDFVISVISVAQHKIVYRYGHPGVSGMGPGYLWNPDDAMMLPDGYILSPDIKNCRILLIPPRGTAPVHVYGESTNACYHQPPARFGSPNGAFPMRDGNYLITEINGDWVDKMNLNGTIAWSTHPPGIAYPSDTNEISPNRYLTVDYSNPGQLIIFNKAGQLLWRYQPVTPSAALNQPSLALPLPNGDIVLNDDYNDRIIVIDPHTDRIVWQFGHTGQPGSAPGYLRIPDGLDLLPPYSLLVSHAATMGLPPASVLGG